MSPLDRFAIAAGKFAEAYLAFGVVTALVTWIWMSMSVVEFMTVLTFWPIFAAGYVALLLI